VKVAAVVVTFNRKELLRQCLQSLLAQTRPLDEIIVVDNASTDGTDKMVESEYSQVTYIKLKENLGGSGGFHIGTKIAYEKGYDWIWMMDDDVFVFPDTLEKLLKEAAERDIVVIVPNQLSLNGRVNAAPLFAGGLLKRIVFAHCGFPDERFFIYWDDIEFGLRITKAGFRITSSNSAFTRHTDWSSSPMIMRNVCGKKIKRPKYSDWKAYYLARNKIATYKVHYPWYIVLFSCIIYHLKEIIAYSLLGEYKKVYYFVLGTVHGFLNKMGKKIEPY